MWSVSQQSELMEMWILQCSVDGTQWNYIQRGSHASITVHIYNRSQYLDSAAFIVVYKKTLKNNSAVLIKQLLFDFQHFGDAQTHSRFNWYRLC